MSGDMQNLLQAYYVRAFPAKQGVRVSNLVSITSTGWETDIYSFDVEHGPVGERKREELILRIYPGDTDVLARSKSAHEFYGMSQLHEAGYPVPQVLVLGRENSPFGKPFVIMERIEGQMLWPILFSSPQEKQQELLTLFCHLLVRLHTLEWRFFVDDVSKYDTGDPYALIDRELDRNRSILTRFHIPGFMPVLEWLEVRRDEVPCLRPSPVHLDYHPNNVILRDDGSAVVIDWTGFDVSDLRSDLAWTMALVSSYEGAEWRQRILHEYERLARVKVKQIGYFEVAACLRRLHSVIVSLPHEQEGLISIRPAATAMMKQQMGAFERFYDLLVERTGIKVAEVERMLASFP